MCLIAFATDDPIYALVLAANRDEYHARATAAAHAWADAPHVFGGRDLEAGGTWLALGRMGRLSAVTNVRSWPPTRGTRSRGALCAEFVRETEPIGDFAAAAFAERASFGGFNLLLFEAFDTFDTFDGKMIHVGDEGVTEVAPGLHAVSNATLDTPWPKSRKAMATIGSLLRQTRGADGEKLDDDLLAARLLEMLADRSEAPDDEIPQTGVPFEIEKRFSPLFIAGEVYGTRASTVILWRRDGLIRYEECSFGPGGAATGVVQRTFGAALR